MTEKDDLPEFLTVSEVAKLMRVTIRTVRRRIAEGELRAVKFGGALRIPRDALLEALTPTDSHGKHG